MTPKRIRYKCTRVLLLGGASLDNLKTYPWVYTIHLNFTLSVVTFYLMEIFDLLFHNLGKRYCYREKNVKITSYLKDPIISEISNILEMMMNCPRTLHCRWCLGDISDWTRLCGDCCQVCISIIFLAIVFFSFNTLSKLL